MLGNQPDQEVDHASLATAVATGSVAATLVNSATAIPAAVVSPLVAAAVIAAVVVPSLVAVIAATLMLLSFLLNDAADPFGHQSRHGIDHPFFVELAVPAMIATIIVVVVMIVVAVVPPRPAAAVAAVAAMIVVDGLTCQPFERIQALENLTYFLGHGTPFDDRTSLVRAA